MSSDVRSAADVAVGDSVSFQRHPPRGDSVVGTVLRAGAARLTVEHRGKRYTLAYTYQHYVSGFNGGMRTAYRFRKLDARDLWWARQPKTMHVSLRFPGVSREYEVKVAAFAAQRDEVIAELDALAAWAAEDPRR